MTGDKPINRNLYENVDSYVDTLYPIDCGLGSNPLGAPEAVEEFWKQYDGTKVDRYYEFSHIVDLSVKVAEYIGATPETVYFANGSLAVLSSIFFKVFTERPKHMLGIGPQFVQAISEWRLSGGTYDAVPMDVAGDLDETVEQLVERIKREVPTLVYLDNPNNPTGRVFTVPQIERVAQACEASGSYCLVDEAYADFLSLECSAAALTKRYERLIVTRSFSKGLGMASIRLGYCVVNEAIADCIQKAMGPFTLSKYSIEMACFVLPKIQGFLERSRSHVYEMKREMTDAFAQKGIGIWATDPRTPICLAYHEKTPLFSWLTNLGVVTESGKHFASTHPAMSDHACRVRVPDSKAHLFHLLYRIKRAAL